MTTSRNEPGRELLDALKAADSVLLLCHVAPDGDTLGSALALRLLLEGMGKQATVAVDGDAPENLAFLPGADELLKPLDAKAAPLAVAVDVSCRERLGEAEPLFAAAKQTIVIDHHGTNDGFGDFNWIDGDAPATAILIHRLALALSLRLTAQEAICLYAALSTDTGNFIYQSVNAETFSMMASLMDAGLPLAEYSRALFRQKREGFVRLLGKALPSLRVLAEGKVAGLRVGLKQFQEIPLNPRESDGVVDYAIDLKGVRMAYFAHENEKGEVKVSLRALAPYRVDQVAALFGGGGHQLAAGCTLPPPLDKAAETIEAKLIKAYLAQKAALHA